MDTAGLLRAQRAAEKSQAAAQSLQSSTSTSRSYSSGTDSIPGAAPAPPSQRTNAGGNGGGGLGSGRAAAGGGQENGKGDDAAAGVGLPVVAPEGVHARVVGSVGAAAKAEAEVAEEGLLGDQGQSAVEGEGGAALDPSATTLEMLPMGAVAHLSRRDRLGIIRKTVPIERRMVVLQRLFHLAQGGCWCCWLVGRCAWLITDVMRTFSGLAGVILQLFLRLCHGGRGTFSPQLKQVCLIQQ